MHLSSEASTHLGKRPSAMSEPKEQKISGSSRLWVSSPPPTPPPAAPPPPSPPPAAPPAPPAEAPETKNSQNKAKELYMLQPDSFLLLLCFSFDTMLTKTSLYDFNMHLLAHNRYKFISQFPRICIY